MVDWFAWYLIVVVSFGCLLAYVLGDLFKLGISDGLVD